MLTAQDIDKLRKGIQNRVTVKVRGIPFTLRPLTLKENCDITSEALAQTSRLLPNEKHSIKESQIVTILTLVQATFIDGVPGATEDTLNLLTADELGYLFNEYMCLMDSVNPNVETLSDAELFRLSEEVKKKPDQLTELSFSQLRNLVRYLVTRTD